MLRHFEVTSGSVSSSDDEELLAGLHGVDGSTVIVAKAKHVARSDWRRNAAS
jgi:hypothetical protein